MAAEPPGRGTAGLPSLPSDTPTAPAGEELVETRRIFPNTAYRAAADVGSKVVSIAFFVVMARKLGEAAFGTFTFGLAFAALVTVLAGFGQDNVLIREVARDRSRLHYYFTNTFLLKLLLAAPVIGLGTLLTALGGMESATRTVVLLLGFAILAELLASTCFAVYQAFERMAFIPIVIISQRVITAAAGIAAMTLGGGVVTVSAMYLAGSLAALVLAVALLFRYVARPELRADPGAWWPLMRSAIPVGIALVLQVVLFRVDTAILQLLKSARVVGAYGAAYRLFESTLFVSWAVTVAAYPVFARLTMRTEPSIRSVFERSLKLVLAMTVPAGVGAFVVAKPLVRVLYGSEFDRSVLPLQLLSAAVILYGVTAVTSGMLLAQDRQRAIAIVYAALTAANVAANFASIPRWSLNAAALITSATELASAAALLWLAYRVVGSLDWRRVLLGPLLAGAAAAVVMILLRPHLAAAIGAGLIIYASTLAGFEHLVYPQDAGAVMSFLRRRGTVARTPT